MCGRDSVCVSAVGGASPVQAIAVRPEMTNTIRMMILISFPSAAKIFNRPYRRVKRPPALTGANSPAGGLAGTPQFPRPLSVPFPSICGGEFGRGTCRRNTSGLSAMPQRWILAGVAEIPELISNFAPCSHCCRKSATPQLRGLWFRRRFRRSSGLRRGGGSGNGPSRRPWGLAHRYTPPAVWQRASHPAPSSPSAMAF